MLQWSAWELLDFLVEKGWKLLPLPLREKIGPVHLKKTKHVTGCFYFNSKMEIARPYLLCLVFNKQLATAGIKTIEHRLPVQQYQQLLDFHSGVQQPALQDDSPFLALEAGEAGDEESLAPQHGEADGLPLLQPRMQAHQPGNEVEVNSSKN